MKKVIELSLLMFCIFIAGCRNNKTSQLLVSSPKIEAPLEEVLELSYVGNMGVLVETLEKTVLFDGFHKEYGPDYMYPTTSMIRKLQLGKYNDFSKIEIACVTHKHGDHFDPNYCNNFLEENREAIVIGPNQVKQEILGLKSQHNEKVGERVKAIAYNNEIHSIGHQGIHVQAIQCNHVNQERHASIENIAYLVEVNGFRILHVGDTHWGLTEEPFEKLAIKSNKLDIAILPYWMLLEDSSKEKMQKLIAPKHIIATHIPPSISKDEEQELMQEFTSITLFTKLGENLTYKKTSP